MTLLWARLREAWSLDNLRVLDAQMEVLDRNIGMALLFSAGTAWLTAISFLWALQDPRACVWAAMLTVISLGGLHVKRVTPSPGRGDGVLALQYARRVRLMATCIGAGWGAFGVYFIEPGHTEATTIVLGLIAGLAAAGLAVFSPAWQIAMLFWLACVPPVAMALIVSQGAANTTLGLAALIYTLAMTTYSYETSRAALRSIMLRFENEGLVQRLREQTQQAQEARRVAEVALGEAEQANRAKVVFMASASHDLRQPLHAAGLFMGALAREPLSVHQRHLLEQTQVSHAAAGEMLNTLMDFSKVDAGVLTPRPAPFALQGLFERLQREVRPLAEQQGLAFRVRPSPAWALADPSLVEMAVRNLLLNAIRYTPRGGVLMGVRTRGERCVIEVWDTGVGIAERHHRAIFEEFHQLSNPERDRRKGLGLGLAIVAGLARAMNLEVGLASRVGRGSVFRLALPRCAPGPQPLNAMQAPLAEVDGLRVLLIEDDPAVRLAMSDLMVALGCACLAAGSVDDVLGQLSGFAPEVIVSDYRLRGEQTGVQAIARLTAQLGRPVPAVIVTGDTAAERLREAHASGFMLLHKPVPVDTLHAALLSLSGRQTVDGAAATAG